DDAGRLGTDLVEVLVGEDDVTALLELVALDDLTVGHFAVAVLAPALLADARLTLAVQLVERDRPARFGRGEHLDRNVHQADLEKPLARGSCGHDFALIGGNPAFRKGRRCWI